MIMRASVLLPFVGLLMLSGCAGVDLVAAGKPADLGDGVSVVPTIAWARIHAVSGPSSLTIDGIGLDEMRCYTGIEPGKPIIDVSGMSNKEIGVYSTSMLPHDVMELLAADMEKGGSEDVRTSGLAPAKFGSTEGFRFDLSYLTKDGLEMKGEALAAQRDGKLDVLLFVAPSEYYYALRQHDADQLFASIQTKG